MTTQHTAKAPARRRRLADVAQWLTTPLLPEDYLGYLNPLWSTQELCGRIETVRPETADAATIVIRPGRDWTGHVAGQWIRLGVEINGVRHWRTFSLSSEPERRDGRISVTVKVTPDGVVSRHLVFEARPGDVVRLGKAEGDFVLPAPPHGPMLFITAGSGITPVMSMLRHLAVRSGLPGGLPGGNPDIVLIHSAPTPADVIFAAELRALPTRLPGLWVHQRHTRADGRFRLSELDRICPDHADRLAWACGPGEMLDEITAYWAAAGISERLRTERFRPAIVAGDGEGGTVRFTKSGRETEADGGTPLLIAGEEAGALLPSGCRMGICYSCVGRLASGRVRDLRTGEVHGEPGDIIQTCVSAAAGPVEIDL